MGAPPPPPPPKPSPPPPMSIDPMTAALTGALQHVDPEDIMNAVKQKAGEVEQVLKPIRTAASPYAQNMMDNEISLVANAITDKVPESSAAVGTVAGVAQSLVSAAPL